MQIKNLQYKEEELAARPDMQPYALPNFNPNEEKWIDLDGTKSIYLKVVFGNKHAPITEINFFNITTSEDAKFVSQSSTNSFRQFLQNTNLCLYLVLDLTIPTWLHCARPTNG
jgi:hypothetical protein